MSVPRPIDAAYRALLFAYPAAFRRRHGGAMAQMFRDAYRRAARRGPVARTAFLARSMGDLTANAIAERTAPFRARLRRYHSHSSRQGRPMFLRSLGTDLRHAWRVFARAPIATTALAVATLALGIGANAAMFSVIYSVLISPLPYPSIDRVSIAWRQNPKLGDVNVSPSLTDVERWRTSASVEGVAAYSGGPMVLTGAGDPQSVDGVRADAGLLDFTGARPTIGRGLTAADTASDGAARVALLSNGLWKQRFGGDRSVIGRTIELDDRQYEIVGVLPDGFQLPMTDVDVVVPLAPPPPAAKDQRQPRSAVSALVRLKPGASRAATADELTALATTALGKTDGWRVNLMPPAELAGATFRRTLLILFGAVGCVLLIACANVAHLVLARNTARRREMAVRVAIGASSWRLARQLFLENVLLALVGAIAGLGLGLWGVQAISAIRPPQMRQLADLRVSLPVFGFSFVLAMVTSVAFGLLPSIASARRPAAEALKQGGASMGSPRSARVRRVLTVAEIALALVLLTGAGLLLRSYAKVLSADRGFRPDGLVAVKLDLPTARYPTPRAQADFTRRAGEAIGSVPGIKRVIMASGVPPAGGLIFAPQLQIEGQPNAGGAGTAMFGGGFVQPGFFEALHIAVRDGRTFTEADLKAESVIVNERTAKRYWPGRSAVGQRLRLGDKGEWSTVVGVVGDIDADHGDASGIQLYFPLANVAMSPDTTLLATTDQDPATLIAAIRARVRTLDPRLPLEEIETMQQAIAKVTARPRFNVLLLSVFAGIGLLLAVIGVYGVVSYSVGLRTREIALRMALGAAPQSVGLSVLKEALGLAAAGSLLGLAAALASARLLQKLLFEVSPNDPVTLLGVALALALTAMIAAWLPARRAMRVDPITALRAE